mmetsp:Transcript_22550/g.36660  ORF Transcript_22550/g.36660 Transcript_22550/m.36660 type:complete len:210 (-) Transcript_22550:2704-3333(-)
MIVVPIPGPDLAQPFAVALGVLAHLHFGAGKDENARCPFVLCRFLDDAVVRAAPIVIHKGPGGPAQGNGRNVFALVPAEVDAGCRQHPDIDVQAQLVTAMTRQHRPATGLADITDIKAPPTGLFGGKARQVLDEIEGLGMAPVAIARQAHRLPGGPCFGQLLSPRDAALGVTAEGCGFLSRGSAFCSKLLLCELLCFTEAAKAEDQRKR